MHYEFAIENSTLEKNLKSCFYLFSSCSFRRVTCLYSMCSFTKLHCIHSVAWVWYYLCKWWFTLIGFSHSAILNFCAILHFLGRLNNSFYLEKLWVNAVSIELNNNDQIL